jgi:hypothetical protein
LWWAIAAVTVVVLLATFVLVRGSRGDDAHVDCAPLQRGVLPTWARTGFSDPRPRMPHVIGRHGRIAAIVFGDPLLSPPIEGRSNKILWVARELTTSASDLRIRAQRVRGGRLVGEAVRRLVPRGPGPSIIDLPSPGCWRLALRWSDQRDELSLRYGRQ